MSAEFHKADRSMIQVVQELIREYHEDLLDLRIAVVGRSEPQNSKGREISADISKFPDKYKPLLNTDNQEVDFMIWIDRIFWGYAPELKRRALIDHVLCHIEYDEEQDKYSLIDHDIAEFRVILERYGFWNDTMKKNQEAAKKAIEVQLQLDIQETNSKIIPESPPGEVITFGEDRIRIEDPLFRDALKLWEDGTVEGAAGLQGNLKIGYPRAARLIDLIIEHLESEDGKKDQEGENKSKEEAAGNLFDAVSDQYRTQKE